MLSTFIQNQIIETLKKYHVNEIAVFGSYARGEENKKSDLDLLVQFESPISLLKLVGIEQELEDKLNRKVDLVTKGFISPHIKPYIEKDLKVIYES